MAKVICCPFIISEQNLSVKCVGIIDHTVQTIKFNNKNDKLEYVNEYCGHEKYWKCCEYAKLLVEKCENDNDQLRGE